jgi:hypothetical protein
MSEDKQADAALTYQPVEVALIHKHLVLVRCPYNAAFIPRAKALRGQWDSENALWVFPGENAERVRWLCESWFGTDGSSTPDLVDVNITFQEAYSQDVLEATLFGRVIASCRGRAATVRVGEGVVFIDGHALSEPLGTGHRAVVAAGSFVRMVAVPRHLAEEQVPAGIEVSIIERAQPDEPATSA